MSFENPPSLDDFQEIIPERPKVATPTQKVVRVLIAVFALVIIVLGLVDFWKSDLSAPLRGTGSVRGIALDENQVPLRGHIYVVGTNLQTQVNPDGSFELKNIPAGYRTIVVAGSMSGREYPVNVSTGNVSDLGTIRLESTATP